MGRRRILTIVGVAMALMGLLWIGQGLGLVRWPSTSFMIDQTQWVTNGAVLAALGLVLVLVGRRTR